MSTSAKSSSKKASQKSPKKSNFFHRLDVRFPWLKLAAVCLLGFIAIIDLLDLTVSKLQDPYDKIKIAPMSYHVRITKRVLEGKMLVALTFDDGPSSATTPTLLDILYKEDVPATFFMLGNMARNNPDIVRRAESEGHIVASHTMYHQNLIRIPTAAVQSDVGETNAVFNSILGHLPALTRPPYGNFNGTVSSIIGTPLILWSVDTLDWKNKSPDAIMSTTLSQVHDGAIILMHDIHPTTVETVPTLINTLRDLGYEFVTIPELAHLRGRSLVSGVAYYNFRP
ncbi:polysaccharide deacetylase family protein [Candidatus Saccharibacteria bacterium]|nr:polysaccharide deacetylase family protein [Candidatus Saccharibacteria bacterium]